MKQWFVVQTKSNQEQFTQKKISDEGFITYLPLYTEVALDRRKNPLERLKSLFPSYLFVAHAPHKSVGDVRHLPGVVAVIGCKEDSVSILPEGWVEELRDKVSSGLFNQALETMNKYLPGDTVEIKEGCFENSTGKVIQKQGKRILLLMTLLNRETRVLLDHSAVHKI